MARCRARAAACAGVLICAVVVAVNSFVVVRPFTAFGPCRAVVDGAGLAGRLPLSAGHYFWYVESATLMRGHKLLYFAKLLLAWRLWLLLETHHLVLGQKWVPNRPFGLVDDYALLYGQQV